jgi:hypothetical protein
MHTHNAKNVHTQEKTNAPRYSRLVAGGLALGVVLFLAATTLPAILPVEAGEPGSTQERLSLITDTPEEGMQVAIRLARLGVTETQPDREVLHALRPEYATDFDALIASSHVIAVHFQTVAAANDYWR